MAITVFDPKSVEVQPIGAMMAEQIDPDPKYDGLREFFRSKDEDGNLSSIVVGDSPRMAVGVGTRAVHQKAYSNHVR